MHKIIINAGKGRQIKIVIKLKAGLSNNNTRVIECRELLRFLPEEEELIGGGGKST